MRIDCIVWFEPILAILLAICFSSLIEFKGFLPCFEMFIIISADKVPRIWKDTKLTLL